MPGHLCAQLADKKTEVVQEGERLVQHINGMTFLPWLPQISPITSESQASLASGRPAGTASPAHELLSALAQMALRQCSPDTSTDEEWEGGQGREIYGREECVYVCVCVC